MKNKIRNTIIKVLTVFSEAFTPKIKRPEMTNKALLQTHLKFTFGDQKGQVDYLVNNVFNYEKNGLKKNGFFVDLACADGVSINNSFFLEKHLGWNGILFEPNPGYESNIHQHRTSKLVTKCVTDHAGDIVRFRVDNGMLGGIVSDETDNSESNRGEQLKNAEILDVETTTLEAELDKIGAPNLIDFLSLDIEGAEWMALKAFSFNKYKFWCMAIERPNELLDLLLEKHGYRQVAHLKFDVFTCTQIS